MLQKHFGGFLYHFCSLLSLLSFRQKYLGAEIYPIVLDDGRILNIKQVENGETNGFGTGATLWAAAYVLSKYLELHYKETIQKLRVCDIGKINSSKLAQSSSINREWNRVHRTCCSSFRCERVYFD